MNYLQLPNKFKILIFIGLLLGLCMFSYGQSSVEATKTDTLPKSQTVKASPQKIRMSIQIGYGYRTAQIAPIPNIIEDLAMKKHVRKLRNNLSFGADFSYLFYKFIGIGVKYNANVSHVLTNDVYYALADGVRKYDYLSEKIEIHYLAPFIMAQLLSNPRKVCLFVNVGAGYVLYRHNATLFVDNRFPRNYQTSKIANSFKHSTAFFAEIGYDFFVSKYLTLGLQLSILMGLKKIESEKLNHIDISLGFRFYK